MPILNQKVAPLYGLVLAGGQSKRMDQDKSLMVYHGLSQVEHCFQILSKVCAQTYVSNRKEQLTLPAHNKLPQIHDQFFNIGPLGGILTAMSTYPNAAWLVVACDLPFIKIETLKKLILNRNNNNDAIAYKCFVDSNLPEPLCAIYEPKLFNTMLKFMNDGMHCPRKILMKVDTLLIEQNDKNTLNNVNDINDYNKAIEKLGFMNEIT